MRKHLWKRPLISNWRIKEKKHGIKNEDDNKSPRKPFIYYYLIVMIVMILFNSLMVPWIQSRVVIEVPYSTFLE